MVRQSQVQEGEQYRLTTSFDDSVFVNTFLSRLGESGHCPCVRSVEDCRSTSMVEQYSLVLEVNDIR